MISEWFNWQKKLAALFFQLEKTKRLGQAHLIQGSGEHVKASEFASCLIAWSLCTSTIKYETEWPCLCCQSCNWYASNSHPNFFKIESLKNSSIKIDAIRALQPWFLQTASLDMLRVVLIDDIQMLTLGAANALLKSLEEPPSDMIFILVARTQTSILPTIRSRCEVWQMPEPQLQDAFDFLQKQGFTNDDANFWVENLGVQALGILPSVDIEQRKSFQLAVVTLIENIKNLIEMSTVFESFPSFESLLKSLSAIGLFDLIIYVYHGQVLDLDMRPVQMQMHLKIWEKILWSKQCLLETPQAAIPYYFESLWIELFKIKAHMAKNITFSDQTLLISPAVLY
jgi:hypothetical protein